MSNEWTNEPRKKPSQKKKKQKIKWTSNGVIWMNERPNVTAKCKFTESYLAVFGMPEIPGLGYDDGETLCTREVVQWKHQISKVFLLL